jgi:catalase
MVRFTLDNTNLQAFAGTKLKRLNWLKIPINKLGETIFKYIAEGLIEIDTKTLEEQFNVKTNKALTMRKREKTVQVLDLKRANTVGNESTICSPYADKLFRYSHS